MHLAVHWSLLADDKITVEFRILRLAIVANSLALNQNTIRVLTGIV